VDLAEDILDVVGAVDFVFFPVAMDFKRLDVEAMADGAMAVCFINGAIRTSEQREMAQLLRRKSQILIAYGSCSCQGGVPGMMNAGDHARMLQWVYEDSPTTHNPERVRPQTHSHMPEGELELPSLDESVKSLDQTVRVDYYIPGCAPPVRLLKDAVSNILAGNLPPTGSVLAPDLALCHDCPRLDSKPDNPSIKAFKRPHLVEIDPDKCLLAQGLLCLGPSTRSGCDAACVRGNMPCSGCLGGVSRTLDQGLASLCAVASLIDANQEVEIDAAIASIPDPVGTFHRYGLPGAQIHRRRDAARDGNGGTQS
jgi:F420-non-reducing hydrogenase small subunit